MLLLFVILFLLPLAAFNVFLFYRLYLESPEMLFGTLVFLAIFCAVWWLLVWWSDERKWP
jgi:hypothetical protein